jgi:hypothetical protein
LCGRRRGGLGGAAAGAPTLGDALLEEGSATLANRALVYDAAFVRDGESIRLRARRAADGGGSIFERLRSLGRLEIELDGQAGVLRSAGRRSAAPLSRMAVTNAPSSWTRLSTAARFRRFLLDELVGPL